MLCPVGTLYRYIYEICTYVQRGWRKTFFALHIPEHLEELVEVLAPRRGAGADVDAVVAHALGRVQVVGVALEELEVPEDSEVGKAQNSR